MPVTCWCTRDGRAEGGRKGEKEREEEEEKRRVRGGGGEHRPLEQHGNKRGAPRGRELCVCVCVCVCYRAGHKEDTEKVAREHELVVRMDREGD